MVTRPTVDEVERGYHGNPVDSGDLGSSGDFDNPDEAEQAILEAVGLFEGVFQDSILYTSEVKDSGNAIRLLCRHKWAIILGHAQSEGQAGSNVTWNLPADMQRSLTRTTYGLEFLEYAVQETPNVGVFRT